MGLFCLYYMREFKYSMCALAVVDPPMFLLDPLEMFAEVRLEFHWSLLVECCFSSGGILAGF